MKFIREYQLKDLTICDAMIDLFNRGNSKALTYPGRVGGGSIIPDIKRSTDFSLDDAGQLGKPDDFKYDLYHTELDEFIDDYLETLQIELSLIHI